MRSAELDEDADSWSARLWVQMRQVLMRSRSMLVAAAVLWSIGDAMQLLSSWNRRQHPICTSATFCVVN